MTRLWAIALTLLAGWLWYPALFPAHVEGFSASIESIARHLLGGDLQNFDRAYPFSAEFFMLSRLGMNLAAAGATLLAAGSSALGLRLLMIAGFALLVLSSLALVRHWTRSPATIVVLILLLLPGLGESAFFYNDNVLSAALAAAALALAARRSGFPAIIGAGALFGAAVLTRSDALLMAPALALLLVERHGFSLALFIRLALGLCMAALVETGALLAFGVTPLDVMRTVTGTVDLWHRDLDLPRQLVQLLAFGGLPIGVLAAIGCIIVIRRRNGLRMALLIGVPALFLLVYWGKLWQARQLLLLTPFVACLAVEGLVALRTAIAGLRYQVVLWCGALLAFMVWPSTVWITDGPHSVTGRLWSPLVWSQWQQSVEFDFATLASTVDTAGPGTSIIITDRWDADRYLHLTLQTAGYAMTPDMAPGGCGLAVEPFTRGDRTILHVRLHLPFLAERLAALPALYQRYAAPCIAAVPAAPVRYLTNRLDAAAWLDGGAMPSLAGTPILPWLTAPAAVHLSVIDLDLARQRALQAFYRQIADTETGIAPVDTSSLAELTARMAARSALLKTP
ncbi:hypothetical protein [Devosia sp.]|uniref:hypothetical protein n=1 Tax=Devosia sp. TaxID=1871048 RepID=UPI003263B746